MTRLAQGAGAPVPWEGRAYSVKRYGATITDCDSEPVQTPGCVQAHGAILVLRPSDLTILQATENTAAVLGLRPEELLGRSIAIALDEGGETRLRGFLAREPIERNPLYVFTLPPRGALPPLDLTAHTVDGALVLELEPAGPLVREPDYYALVKKTVGRLQTATSLREFCDLATDEVRALTGFDRVMVYRFHPDGHGEVFAERRRDDLPPWLGLHYPADDIPSPARAIFTRIWVRPMPDVTGGLAELVPLVNPDTGAPLEMTHCALRGASILYTEYLQNMGVTAGLTLSIRRGDALWGLIACHHYAGPRHIPYQVRAACEFLAQVVSVQHKAAEDREHLEYRHKLDDVHHWLIAQAGGEPGPAALTEGTPTLLDGIAAGGAALHHGERWSCVGETPAPPELDALGAWLAERPELQDPADALYATDELGRVYPPAAAFADRASGVLAVPLSRDRRSLVLWLRPETIRTVAWGGDPHARPTKPGPLGRRLTPRASFERFLESVRGRSLPWKTVELEAAARLRLLLMELVVSRADRLAQVNEELVRRNEELDAFAYVASHDLKEPLRGIHKYAHQLLEGVAPAEVEPRRKIETLLRLSERMDNLLDSLLHFSRVGRVALDFEELDLDEVVAEAIEIVAARRMGEKVEITTPRPLLPSLGDHVRCREIFTNLLSNAIKYNDREVKRIEIGYIAPDEDHPRRGFPEEARRHTVYYVKDNGIGISPRHRAQVFKMFKRLHGRGEYGGGTGAGLTIVKRLVERHHGQIWFDSSLGEGTTFYFTLPCQEA